MNQINSNKKFFIVLWIITLLTVLAAGSTVSADPEPVEPPHGNGFNQSSIEDSRVVQLNDVDAYDENSNRILSENYFTANMPIASIWINENVLNFHSYKLPPDKMTATLLNNNNGLKMNTSSNENDYGQLYFDFTEGSLSYGSDMVDNVWDGDVAEYKILDAGEWINPFTQKEEKVDLVITYSNLHISLQDDLPYTQYNKFTKLDILDTNYVMPILYANSSISSNIAKVRSGAIFDVNVKVVKKNGKLVDGSFYFPMVDLDISRRDYAGYKRLYQADTLENDCYSEHVELLSNYGMPTSGAEWAEKIWIPGGDYNNSLNNSQKSNMPYLSQIKDVGGNLVITPGNGEGDKSGKYDTYPKDGYTRVNANGNIVQGRDQDFYTGFATLANNSAGGIKFRMWATTDNNIKNINGVYKSGTVESTIMAGSVPVNHKAAASSDEGGTIFTTTTGNADGKLTGGDLLGTDKINSPYTISVATGQSVTYTMTPKLGYRIKNVWVKPDDINVIQEKIDQYKIPNCADNQNGGNCYEYQPDDGTYTYTFSKITQDKSIHVEWEKSGLTVTKEVIESNQADNFDFRIQITPPDGYENVMNTYRAMAWLSNQTGTATQYTFESRLEQGDQYAPTDPNTPGGYYDGEYLIYDQVNYCFVGWDEENQEWLQKYISNPTKPVNNLFTDEAERDRYLWKTMDKPKTDNPSAYDRLIYNKSVGFPEGSDQGTPLIRSAVFPYENEMSVAEKTQGYDFVQPVKQYSSNKLAFYWNADESRYEFRNNDDSDGKYKEVIFYSYTTEDVTVDLDTEYINLKDYDERFEPIAGGGSSYTIQLPKTEKYDTAQLEYLLQSKDVNFDGCEVIPVSDTTVLDDLIAAWNRSNPNQRISRKDEDNNIYQFTLSYNGSDSPSIDLQAIVPFGWSYRIWEVDKNGLEVTSENPVFTTTNGGKWEFLGSEPENTDPTEMDPLSDETPEFTFKNGEPVSIAVHKIWDDEDNRDGVQPRRVFFYVKNDGTGKWAASSFVTEANKEPGTEESWTIVFDDLPKYSNYPNGLIEYSVHEFYLPELSRYTIVKSPDGKDGVERNDTGSHYKYFDVTNKYVPEKIEIPVYKIWDDAENQDGKRPKSVTVYIKQSSETNPTARDVMDPNDPTKKLQLVLNANNDWQGRFTDLYKYDPVKKEITYTLEEDQTGLSGVYNQPGGVPQIKAIIDGNQSAGYIITNSYTPETRELTVNKTWEGNDGTNRPSMSEYLAKLSVSIDDSSTKYFFENLTPVSGTTNQYTASLNGIQVTIVTAQNNNSWTITINGLPKNRFSSEAEGVKEIKYNVTEEPIPNYCGETSESNSMESGFSFTNKWNLKDVTVTKTWDDAGHENMRPNSIKIYLSGSDGSLRYHDLPKSDLEYVFEDLPVYTLSGGKCNNIIYTTYEEKVTNYNESVDGYTITNTYSETNTLNIHVTKSWDDDNNRDNVRPGSVTIKLLSGTPAAETGRELELSESNGWSGIFRNLPIKDGSGADIKYDVSEVTVPDYTVAVTKNTDMSGVSIKNTRPIDTVTLTMTKQWDDENDRYSERLTNPQKLLDRLRLIGDGTEYTLNNCQRDGEGTSPYKYNAKVYGHAVTIEVTMSPDKSADPWTVKITGLPKNKNGQPISWDLNENPDTYIFTKEAPVKGADGNFTVTGKNFLNWTQVQLTKTWIDDSGSTRDPLKFLNGVKLYANGQYYYDGTYNQKSHPDDYTWTFSASAYPDLLVTIVDNRDNTWTVTIDKLPREINGRAVTWTVEEEMEGYDSVVDGFNITNVQKTEVTVHKTWDDVSNQDGKRQATIITLLADGKSTGKTAAVPVTDGWSHTFSDLPKYEKDVSSGEYRPINYTVSETAIEGYTTVITPERDAYEYWITNTHSPETVDIKVNKTWDDASNQDGLRRETTVRLLADGRLVDEETVTITGNTWEHTFSGKPKYQQGAVGGEIHYTVEENPVAGYTTTFTQSGNTWSFINKHIPETVDIRVTKVWSDAENQDGLRPDEITVNLYKNSDVKGNQKLSEQNNWTYTFTGLPVYESSVKITYTVDESPFNCHGTQTNCLTNDESTGYKRSIQTGHDGKSFTIINTHTPETVTVQGTKTWVGVPDSVQKPDSITVFLWADGNPIDSTEGLKDDDYQWSFPDLPKKANGSNIQYSITEEAIPGYTRKVPASGTKSPDGDGYKSLTFKIINEYDTENLSLRVTKIWDDDNDRDGLRPEKITVSLKVNNIVATDSYGNPCTYELNSSENWTHLFTVPSHDSDGNPLVYTPEEADFNCKKTETSCLTGDPKTGYQAQPVEGGMEEGYFRFTNTHTPAEIEIPVTKVWKDDDNRDKVRPGSVTFVVTRTNENTAVGAVTLSGAQTEGKFTGLYKYCGNGTLCSYTITEPQVPDGYQMTSSGCTNIGESSSCTITNSHTPETVVINVTKVWDDADNQDGIRPSNITVTLYKGSVAPENVVKDDKGDPLTVTLNSANGWTAFFPARIAKENGQLIVYAVDESNFSCPRVGENCLGTDAGAADKGYQKVSITGSAANGFVITNKHNPEKITVRGTKEWIGVPAGYVLPDSITIELRLGNTSIAYTVGRKTNDPAYSWAFTNLDKYADGELINYTVAEYDVPGFTKDVPTSGTRSDDEITFEIRNTYNPDKTQVRVSKIWDDDTNRDNLRPESITVKLYSDNGNPGNTPTPVKDKNGEDRTLILRGDSWSGFFTDLTSYNDAGAVINYTVDEEPFSCNAIQDCLGTDEEAARSGYQKVSIVKTEAGGYAITNKHISETVDITVNKEWDDANNQDGIRPGSVSFVLKRTNADNSVTVLDAVTLSGETLSHTFRGLPKNCGGGAACKYTVDEPQVPQGYQMVNNMAGTSCVDMTSGGRCTIKNSHTPEMITIPVTKVWDDMNNTDDSRPKNVVVEVLADGVSLDPKVTITLNNDSTPAWTGTSSALPKYKNKGERIAYTIKEYAVEGYTTSVPAAASRPEDGYTITNTRAADTQPLVIRKTWEYGDAPEREKLNERGFLGKITVLIDGNKYYFTNVKETSSGYSAVVNGIPVTITAIGTNTANWTVTISGLPKNKWDAEQENPVPISYSIEEDPIANYYTEYGEPFDAENGFPISNKYNVTEVTVTKSWVDDNDSRGDRPESVLIHLHGSQDGSLREQAISAANAVSGDSNTWSYTFNNLPKYDSNGAEITYYSHEVNVDHYISTVSADKLTITNTWTDTRMININVNKYWDDDDNRDGKRPDSVTFNLLVDGVKQDSMTVTGPAWTGVFGPLPYADESGTPINYSVTEDTVVDKDGKNSYTPKSGDPSGSILNGLVFTNSRNYETVKIRMTKTWDDFSNMYNLRGEQPLKLLQRFRLIFGTVQYSLDNLTMTQEGNASTPYIFTASVQGYPVTITASGVTDTSNSWTIEIDGLPKYKNGSVINYDITENLDTYAFTRTKETTTEENTFVFTGENFLNMQRGVLTKVWEDENNKDGKRPTDPMKMLEGIRLYANGEYYHHGAFTLNSHEEGSKFWTYTIAAHPNVLVTVEDTNNNQWKVTVDKLPRVLNGQTVIWTVSEEMDGYDSFVNGLTITNVPQVSVDVRKVWNDGNNQDGIRPASVTVNLFKGSSSSKTQVKDEEGRDVTLTLSEGSSWTGSFTGLPKYETVSGAPDLSAPINYSVEEQTTDVLTGTDGAGTYAIKVEGTMTEGYTITNTHTPELIDITLSKVWDDNHDQDGKRAQATVQLYANGVAVAGKTLTVPVTDDWTTGNVFTNLPKYQNGVEINYEIRENPPAGYTPAIVTGNGIEKSFRITNTYSAETVNVAVRKVWDDNNNQDNLRSKLTATVQLLADGAVVSGKTLTVGITDSWSDTFTGLPKYAGGKEIKYTVEEKIDYDSSVTGTPYTISYDGNMKDGFTITNKHEPSKINVTITKEWDDNSNQDGVRRSGIAYYLQQNGTVVATYTSTNDDDFKSNGGALTNTWSHTFENLPEYCSGTKCTYVLTEPQTPRNYTQAYKVVGGEEDKLTIVNSHTPETVTVQGSKTWVDNDNRAGKRPGTIYIKLWKNGSLYTGSDALKTITANSKELDGTTPWSWKWEGLPKFENGREIQWSVLEENVSDYQASYPSAYNVTNTYNEGTKSISVKKVWDDEDNRDGIRPTYIYVDLYADGVKTGQSKALADANNWLNTFTDLPIYKAGETGVEIQYTVKERDAVSFYSISKPVFDSTTNTFTITNSHTPETTTVAGHKTWVNRDLDTNPPSSITVHLYADGAILSDKDKTITESSMEDGTNPWSWKWEGLPKYKEGEVGKEIVYTVRETPIQGYNTTIDSPNVTNTYSPGKTSLSVRKAWMDGNNQDGIRPGHVEVALLSKVGTANFSPTGQTAILVPDTATPNLWRVHTFTNLDRYTPEGQPITYSVKEIGTITGYTSSAPVLDTDSGVYVITNTHTPETITITGEKVWDNDDDPSKPESVTIHLLANGTEVSGMTKTVSAETVEVDGKAWTWKWEGLPKYANGREITYTVSEDTLDDYTLAVQRTPAADGTSISFVLTNTYEPGMITVRVQKVWNDNNDQDGIRPATVEVKLIADGDTDNPVAIDTLPQEGTWRTRFNVPEYDGTRKIVYTVEETATEVLTGVDGAGTYAQNITGDVENGFVITNIHTPETVYIHGDKKWEGDDDAPAGTRPDAVTLTLLADGTGIAYTVAQEVNNWKWSFPDQPKYANGEEITYNVIEYPAVDGYEVTEEAFVWENDYDYTITNTYKPESVSVKVTKVWDDADNQDGWRPTSLTINLYKNGDTETVVKTLTLPIAGEWSGTFSDLPKYENGEEIQYTVDEAAFTNSGKYTKVITGDMSQGYTITNTHEPETITVKGTKVWVDPDNSTRPDHITLELLGNSKRVGLAVGEEPNYEWEFEAQPKFAGGKLIHYVVTEFDVPGYTRDPQEVDRTETEITYVVTNTYNPEAITLRVTKDWEDDNDHDGFRPDSLTVTLWQGEGENKTQVLDENDEPVTLTLTAESRWTGTFQDLPKHDSDGNEIVYSVDEDAFKHSDRYEKVISGDMTEGYIITNTHVPEKITIRGTKVWNDADAPEGSRPERIALELKANNVHQAYAIGYAASDYAWEFTDLDKYADGAEILYVVTEISPEGYVPKVERLSKTKTEMIYQVTNTYAPDKVRIRVSKNWNDLNNRDGYRPESLTISLYQVVDGDNVPVEGKTLTLNAANRWTDVLSDLPKYDENENEIVYTVDEEDFTNSDKYVKSINGSIAEGFTITNTYTPETVTIEGIKVWEGDEDAPEGTRPDHVTIQVSANGKVVNTTVATEKSDWEWSFGELPKYENSVEIDYTVQEYTVPGYTKNIDKDEDSYYFTVTNTYNPDETTVRVTKSWSDGNNQDGIRPESITVNLFKGEGDAKEQVTDENGDPVTLTLNAAGRWTGTFDHLPKYEDQVEIVYSVDEEPFDKLTGDKTTGYERALSGNLTSGFVITNTHTPETLTISGTKVWNHKDAPEEKYPSHATIELMADGVVKAITTATEDTDWKWSFTNLPKNRYDGQQAQLINYTFSEYSIRDYDVEYGADNTITNTYQSNITSVQVTKVWDDADNQDNLRDQWVLVKLLENGEETDRMAILNEGNKWTHTFNNLEIERNGEEIVYTVEEQTSSTITGTDGPGTYAVKVTGDVEKGFIVTNTHTPQFINISGQKVWDDDDNNDGLRPDSITIRLLADSKEVDHVVVTESDGWAWEFTDKPKYSGTKQINYTVEEDPVAEYSPHVSGDADTGFTVTNSYTPGETSVTVNKVWNDQNDQDGNRPGSVTVNLLANGEQADSVILTANNNWEHTFEELPEMEDGEMIEYTVEEVSVPDGYTSVISGDASSAIVITNTYKPETINIPVAKVWKDNENQDGVRPNAVTIRLLANGNEVDRVVLQEGTLSHTFINKPVFRSGHQITYTVSEDSVTDYSVRVSGSAEIGFTVTNTYEPDVTSLHVSKVWEDDDNRDGMRPTVITVNLLANGEKVDSHTLSAENNWSYDFEKLPVKADGETISYTVEEVSVEGYVSTIEGNAISGYKLVNAHTPEKVDVRGVKIWDDNNDEAGARPESIIVRLNANEVEIASQSVYANEEGNWEWAFTGLNKYADGKEIVYTIKEDAPDNYSAVISGDAKSGFTITNTYAENTTSLFVSKHWTDVYNQDGVRPQSVSVKVLADYGDGNGYVETEYSGEIKGPDWELIINDLPLMTEDGVRIKYKVSEETAPDYTAVVEGDQTTGYMITNVHEPETVDIRGEKTWDDSSDAAGQRPDYIIIRLMSDGTLLHEVRVTEEDEWKWSFIGLPKYKGGVEIKYTITEQPVDHYAPVVDGYNVTNILTEGTRSLPVNVSWDDENNRDGIRPDKVTIKLFKDGVDTGLTIELDENGDWGGSFEDLDICGIPMPGAETVGKVIYDEFCALQGKLPAEYTIEEVRDDVITGEDTETTYVDDKPVGSSDEGYTINNRHTPAKIDIEGSKTWRGSGTLPESITVRLLADNEEIDSRTVTAADGWSWSFTGLWKNKDGVAIDYTITEDIVEGFSTVINGYDITNSYTPGYTSLSVSKVWEDDDNAAGARPAYVTVRLLANGTEKSTVNLNSGNNWRYTWKDLPVADEGGTITYTVEETVVPEGYEARIIGNMSQGYKIYNTYTAEPETITIPVRKVWRGEGEHPESVTIELLVNSAASGQTLVLDESVNWAGEFADLPVRDERGLVIRYSVRENDIPEGYIMFVSGNPQSGFVVTNSERVEPDPIEPPEFFEFEGELPETGITTISGFNRANMPASVNYLPTTMELQLPTLDIMSTIVSIEPVDGRYPVEWLGFEAGLLEGTAIPGQGISVLAAHNTLNREEYGPFASIMLMQEGDRFFINDENGDLMIFQVYANEKIGSHDYDALWNVASEFGNTVTLLTCEDERAEGGYASRRVVAARKVN